MRYYVVADIHGFYDLFIESLTEKGFFADKEPHKLIICGDLFDRGRQPKEIQEFVVDLIKKDEIILIKGNHEDLMLDFIDRIDYYVDMGILFTHHFSNRTVQTVYDLTGCDGFTLEEDPSFVAEKMRETDYIKIIIPAMVDYYETKNYIFVHGWIPCNSKGFKHNEYFSYKPDWREEGKEGWGRARWHNGILAASQGVIEPNKTIVCGHWHASYGHAVFEGKGKEFTESADNSPYYSDGIIALDACTAFSKVVNCIVVEDDV